VGTTQDLITLIGKERGSRIGRGNVEVVEPGRRRDHIGFVHHATDWVSPGCKQLVGAHRPHVDDVPPGPTEPADIEIERTNPVRGIELVPANMTRRPSRCG
jgi:hypothetical protein